MLCTEQQSVNVFDDKQYFCNYTFSYCILSDRSRKCCRICGELDDNSSFICRCSLWFLQGYHPRAACRQKSWKPYIQPKQTIGPLTSSRIGSSCGSKDGRCLLSHIEKLSRLCSLGLRTVLTPACYSASLPYIYKRVYATALNLAGEAQYLTKLLEPSPVCAIPSAQYLRKQRTHLL